MSLTIPQLRARVHADYPREDWHNQCAGWAYYACRVTGTVSRVYGTATAAYHASTIVSADPSKAPAGAFHFWSYWTTLNGRRDDYGHVALATGHGRAIMTDPEDDEATWGTNLGETDVARWTARRRGIVRYLGWARTYGANTASITPPAPAPADTTHRPVTPVQEEDDPMARITLHHRNEGTPEWTLGHPQLSCTLADGSQHVGFLVITDPAEAVAAARIYKNGAGDYDSSTNRADYIKIQEALEHVAKAYRLA